MDLQESSLAAQYIKSLEIEYLSPGLVPFQAEMDEDRGHPVLIGGNSGSVTTMLSGDFLMEQKQSLWHSKREASASMTVFTTVMLHAWRQRRDEVRQLQATLDRLKTTSMKAKNQLHVYNTLMRVEQKRNRELQLQLKESTINVSQVRSSCDSLTSSVLSLTADKALLEQELDYRKKDYEALEVMLVQTKKDLFAAMLQQRTLQTELSKEQRNMQQLVRDNEQLMEEVMKVRDIDNDRKEIESRYRAELKEKDDIVQDMRQVISKLEQDLSNWNIKSQNKEIEHMRATQNRMINEFVGLREHLDNMQMQNIQSNTSAKLERISNLNVSIIPTKYSCLFHKICVFTSNFMYFLWFYLLPSKPLAITTTPLQALPSTISISTDRN